MRQVFTERDVPSSGQWNVAVGSIVTPSARDLARERGVCLVELPANQISILARPDQTVAIGSDHGGFAMKKILLPLLEELGLSARDVGVFEEKPADYPDIALMVTVLVAEGRTSRGIILDGAGIGSCMAANKVRGIRAAVCWDVASARNSREHNNANVLTLGGRLLTDSQAETIVRTWLSTPFAGGRHEGRIAKMMEIEKRP